MVAATQYDPNYIPVQGDVIDIDFSPQAGREIWDWRPALVLSTFYFNSEKNVAVMCPITRTGRERDFEKNLKIQKNDIFLNFNLTNAFLGCTINNVNFQKNNRKKFDICANLVYTCNTKQILGINVCC